MKHCAAVLLLGSVVQWLPHFIVSQIAKAGLLFLGLWRKFKLKFTVHPVFKHKYSRRCQTCAFSKNEMQKRIQQIASSYLTEYLDRL